MKPSNEREATHPEVVEAPAEAEPTEAATIERLLDRVHAPAAPEAAAPALRTARVLAVQGKQAQIAYRGGATVTAILDDGVDAELVARALLGNERVLVEADADGAVIVGVVQTRLPDVVEIKARKVVIEGEEELLLRSGRGALRIREDGDVELVGSRISTLSRGLFRIVGRVLRLN